MKRTKLKIKDKDKNIILTKNGKEYSISKKDAEKYLQNIIGGYFYRDENFTYVFTEDIIYIFANNTGQWNSIKIGTRMYNGEILTEELFNKWKLNAKKYGHFDLW